MRIAFYAPMKAPDHPVPSGDRRMARLFMRVLADLGHEVCLVSRFRSWDDGSRPDRAGKLSRIGGAIAGRLVDRFAKVGWQPDLWFTYHLYHKAPDWLGPPITKRLNVPYLVAEASYAAKQATGPFALGHAGSVSALQLADAVIAMSTKDESGLAGIVGRGRLVRLPPFLDPHPFIEADAARTGSQSGPPRLLTVAMMRAGDKQESYRLLGLALERLMDRDWTLTVVGDGIAAEAVRRSLPQPRTRFLGKVANDTLPALYASADLFVWPAINEAYGLAPLEAQAAGCPVVLGRTGGTPDIVADGVTGLLTPSGDVDAFASAVGRLLDDPAARTRMGRAASQRVVAEHSLERAGATLDGILRSVRR